MTMPRTKNKYQFVKVFRPNGTPYGQGRGNNITDAIMRATSSFINEFGYLPKTEDIIIECFGCTGGFVVDYFEVKQ
jgi:hypothetical protein